MPLTSHQVLALLGEAPRRITAVTAGQPPVVLQTGTADGGWSANEVLAHLRACADIWGGAIESILVEDNPTMRAVNPRTWIDKTKYLELKFQPSFRAYTAQRKKLVAELEALKPKEWLRTATVTGAGKALERSVLFYAEWLATHERAHVKQIGRIVNAFGNE